MAVTDYIAPVTHHTMGFPPQLMMITKNITPAVSQPIVRLLVKTYEQLLKTIDKGISGRGVAVDEEEKAAMYVAHLVLDAAYLHNCLGRAGVSVGEFPYNHLADKILPEKKEWNMSQQSS